VVSTFTLCMIDGVMDALGGISRVLRPEGKLIFYEISRSPEGHVRRWQRWWEPVHRSPFVGLYVTRDVPALLTQAGFRLDRLETGYVAPFPKSWSQQLLHQAYPRRHAAGGGEPVSPLPRAIRPEVREVDHARRDFAERAVEKQVRAQLDTAVRQDPLSRRVVDGAVALQRPDALDVGRERRMRGVLTNADRVRGHVLSAWSRPVS